MTFNNLQNSEKPLITDIQSRLNGENIIAVASGKGGVGKTTFAVTLAQAFSKQGLKVLLFDGDLGLSNIDAHLGIVPNENLETVLKMNDPLNLAITHDTTIGCDIITGHSGDQSLATMSEPELKLMTDDLLILATYYDKVIIDLASGIGAHVTALGEIAKTCLTMITDTPTSLTDAYQFIQLMLQKNSSKDFRLIVNMIDTISDGEKTYQTFLTALKTFLHIEPELLGIIHYDSIVKKSVQAQTPLLSFDENSIAAKDILKITDALS